MSEIGHVFGREGSVGGFGGTPDFALFIPRSNKHERESDNSRRVVRKGGYFVPFISSISSSTKLVIVGHSLGGGAAALMSLFLQRNYPNTCCCFDPPGETLSPGLREYSTHFCTTTVFGHDIFPRVSSYTFSLLQDNVIASLAHCRRNKIRYFLDVLLRRVTMESAFAAEIGSEEVRRSLEGWLKEVRDGVGCDGKSEKFKSTFAKECYLPGRNAVGS